MGMIRADLFIGSLWSGWSIIPEAVASSRGSGDGFDRPSPQGCRPIIKYHRNHRKTQNGVSLSIDLHLLATPCEIQNIIIYSVITMYSPNKRATIYKHISFGVNGAAYVLKNK